MALTSLSTIAMTAMLVLPIVQVGDHAASITILIFGTVSVVIAAAALGALQHKKLPDDRPPESDRDWADLQHRHRW